MSSVRMSFLTLFILICTVYISSAQFVINSPPNLAGAYASLRSSFSATIPPLAQGINASIVVAYPCAPLSNNTVQGKVVITSVDAKDCAYATQALNVYNAGGVGLILWKNQSTLLAMLNTAFSPTLPMWPPIPTISVGNETAQAIITNSLNTVVNITIGHTPAPAAQKQALLEMWNSTGGASWLFGKVGYNKWDPATEPCSAWYGIACNAASGDIKGISMPINVLSGTIPSSIGALTGLSQIQLTGNNLLKSIPAEMLQLPRMRYFELSSCGLAMAQLPDINMPNLMWFKLDTQANLTGTIPASITSNKNLTILLLNGNQLKGSIPEDIGSLPSLATFSVSSNKLSGSLPDSLGNLRSIISLQLASNSFYGAMPVSLGLLRNLSLLDISGNQFGGALPSQLFTLTSLTYLNVANNAFSGTLPNFNSTRLITLDVSHNQFYGVLDGKRLPSTLFTLKAAYNQFTSIATFPATSTALSIVDVSYNNLTSVTSLKAFPAVTADKVNAGQLGLTYLDMSHNQMANDSKIFDANFVNYLSLITIDLSYNNIGGTWNPPSTVNLKNLQIIDFSNNKLEGAVPDFVIGLPSLSTLNIVNNYLHHDKARLYPKTTTPDYLLLQDNSTGNFFCPSFVGRNGNMAINMDSYYHDFQLCICKEGYRRIFNTTILQCERCPAHMICQGGINDSNYTFELNYFPTPSFEDPQYMLDCPNCVNLGYTAEELCGEGYENRLCSQCSTNFYKSSDKCHSCKPSGLILFCVVVGLIVAIICGFAIIAVKFGGVVEVARTSSIEVSSTALPEKTNHTTHPAVAPHRAFAAPVSQPSKIFARWRVLNSIAFEPSIAIITIVINYTQTLALLTRNLSLNYSFRQFVSAISIANISGTGFGAECVNDMFGEMLPNYLFTSLQPLFVTFVAFMAILAGIIVLRLLLSKSYKWWAIVCLKSWLFLIDFLFFPVVLNCMSYFKCSADPATNISYLDNFPYAECDSITPGVKFGFLLVNLLGIFFLFMGLLVYYYKLKSKSQKARVEAVFGFFFSCYKPRYMFAGLLYLARRLLFSIFNGLLEPHSLQLYLCNMIFISLSLMLIYTLRPFRREVDNFYEITAFICLSFTYSILYVGYFTDPGVYMIVFYFLANAALYFCFFIVLVVSKFPTWGQIRSIILCEWARGNVERFEEEQDQETF